MRHADREAQVKRKYSRISFKKREKLIEDVENSGLPLSYISKKLKIKQSTARMILRKFKESGQFRTKNFKNKRNTDLREWGTIKNAGDVQKSEQLEPHHCEDPSQENSEALPSEIQPKIEEEAEQSTYSPHLYWCYYLPAYDYISFC